MGESGSSWSKKNSLLQVDEDYISDQFNLTGLSDYVPNIKAAIDKVLDYEAGEIYSMVISSGKDALDSDESSQEEADSTSLEQAAEMFYGLVHARYILTNRWATLRTRRQTYVYLLINSTPFILISVAFLSLIYISNSSFLAPSIPSFMLSTCPNWQLQKKFHPVWSYSSRRLPRDFSL